MTDLDPPAADEPTAEPALTVYWRPGCPFCTSLSIALGRLGVPYREVDIWDDPDAAAFVRAHANGHETVPTVALADVVLVNPSVHELMAVAADHAPELVPAGYEPPQPGRLARWMAAKLGGTDTN